MFMNVFRFKVEDDKIIVMSAKVVGEPLRSGSAFCSDGKSYKMIRVGIDHESELFKTISCPNKSLRIPAKEGIISHRTFWLEEEDHEKADEIIHDYYKAKWLKAQKAYGKFGS